MFTPKDLLAKLKQQPFRPFKVQMSHGDTYVVTHPDQAMVTRGYLIVGLPPEAADNGGVFESSVELSILHITELRPVQHGRRPRTTRP